MSATLTQLAHTLLKPSSSVVEWHPRSIILCGGMASAFHPDTRGPLGCGCVAMKTHEKYEECALSGLRPFGAQFGALPLSSERTLTVRFQVVVQLP